MSVGTGEDGRVLATCHAGCTIEAIVAAIGLQMSDLFEPNRRHRSAKDVKARRHRDESARPVAKSAGSAAVANVASAVRTFTTPDAALTELERRYGPRAATWTYHDEKGEAVGLVVRWNTPTGKDVLPVSRRADGSGWIVGGMPTPRPLYGLPELLAMPPGSRIYITEGEKTADAVRAVGLTATTSPHGSESAAKADWTAVAGHDVVILPDHDKAGTGYAEDVVRLATAAGAKSVRVIRLAELWAGMPEGGDMADLVAHRSGDVELIRAEVESLTNKTEPEGMVRDSASVPTFAPIAALDLIRDFPRLRPVVIMDLLREGETMNVVAAPKVGKSWLVHALAVAVVSGRDWLGKATTRGRVLLIDGELHRESLARRLRTVQTEMDVSDSDMAMLKVWPLRGRRLTIDGIDEALQAVPTSEYRLIVIDPLYRFLPPDGEENANETMTRVYNTLDGIAQRARVSVVVVHHASKGNQSERAVTDVGAGAGSQSRAADTHMILRPHKADDAVVVDAVVRSFPPMDSFVIRSTKCGWALACDLDPALLRRPSDRVRKAVAETPARAPIREWTPEDFATEIVGRTKSIRDDVIARGVAVGLGKGQADALLKRALDAGKVHRHQDGPTAPHRFSIDPPAVLPKAGEGGMVGATPAPGANAPGGVGGIRATPLPPLARSNTLRVRMG